MTEQQEKMLDVLAKLTKWVERGHVSALCVLTVGDYPPGSPVRAGVYKVIPDQEKSPTIDALLGAVQVLEHDLLPHPCAVCKGEHRPLYCDPPADPIYQPFQCEG